MAMAAVGQLNMEESQPTWWCRRIDCFQNLGALGEGTYGQVFKARDMGTGEIVAVKKLILENEAEGFPRTAIREIKILTKFRHDNIIKLKEIVIDNNHEGSIYMVFEYMDSDLARLSRQFKLNSMQFTLPLIKHCMRQLLTGLHYCHVNQVLHRDIKSANILVDNEGNLKLADFGLARPFTPDSEKHLTNRVVTLWYRPPELLLGSTKYGPAVDMWSVGCIFAELLIGREILRGDNEPHQLKRIFELCGAPDENTWAGASMMPWYNNLKLSRPMKRRIREVFRGFDRHAVDLLDKMLVLDPSRRISAKEALDAKYFWTDPLPCDPASLPKYKTSHKYQTNQKRHLEQQNEEAAKRQKVQHHNHCFGKAHPPQWPLA